MVSIKMRRRFFLLFCFLFLLFFSFYLLLPDPAQLPPLPGALKSTEPGDTYQIPGIAAYYTDLSRQEVIAFYQQNYSRSRFLNLPLITYRLNHPPEYVKIIIRSTQQSSYFEEIVHPLRESLFVNGFEWENDPFTKPESRPKNKMIVNGYEYKSKVTLIARSSYPPFRIIAFFGFVFLVALLLREAGEIYGSFRRGSKL